MASDPLPVPDGRWFGPWSERDSWPDVKIELSLAPWTWRLRPRRYLDELSWYGWVDWLFLRITLCSNGARRAA